MKNVFKSALLLAVSATLTSQAMAAFTFANGDVVLGFQATGGTGSTTNVFFNLGSTTSVRDNLSGTNVLGNISTSLTAAYGSNWYSRTDLYFGVIGNLNNQAATGFGSTGPVDGDPSRTLYISQAAATPESGFLFAPTTFPTGSLGSIGTTLGGMETMLASIAGTASQPDNAAILIEAANPTAWQNGWTVHNPGSSGSAFGGNISGGIQQSFGKGTPETYVDIQRILATNTGANPTGTIGGGDYIGTLAISENGNIAFIPEPSTSLLAAAASCLLILRRRRTS